MMSDAIDDALDNDEAEEETEELTNQVGFLLDWKFPHVMKWEVFCDGLAVTFLNKD